MQTLAFTLNLEQSRHPQEPVPKCTPTLSRNLACLGKVEKGPIRQFNVYSCWTLTGIRLCLHWGHEPGTGAAAILQGSAFSR